MQLSTLLVDHTNKYRKSFEETGNIFVKTLDSLLSAKMVGLAGRFLYVCQTQLKVLLENINLLHSYEAKIQYLFLISFCKNIIFCLQGILPDTSHAMVVCEEVTLAYARHLFFDCGNAKAAFFYCKKVIFA